MGIPGFQKWLLSNFPEAVRVQGNKFGQVYDHVTFDMNQILHKSARRAHDHQSLAAAIFRELDQILKSCVPRKSIFFAFDGPGPLAKLLTQRKRRNKTKHAYTDAPMPGSSRRQRYAKPSIDGLQFTPGVEIVYFVRDATEYWAYTRLQNDRKYHDLDIRISGSDVAGEGELKVIDYCRSGYVAEMESVVVIGGDADIVLQGLATIPVRNFFVYLHHFGATKGKKLNFVISVWEITRTLERLFPGESSGVRIDFILLSILNGNDYIPKIRGITINRVWNRYYELKTAGNNGGRPPFRAQCLIDAAKRTFNWEMFHALIHNVGVPVPSVELELRLNSQNTARLSGLTGDGDIGKRGNTLDNHDTPGEEPTDTIVYTGNEDGIPLEQFEAMSDTDNASIWTLSNRMSRTNSDGELPARKVTAAGDYSDNDSDDNNTDDDEDEDDFDDDVDDISGDGEEDGVIDEDRGHIENLVAIAGDSKRFYDTERWLRTVLWTLHMYIDGYCSDYTFQYGKPYGPSCDALAKYITDHDGNPFAFQAPVSVVTPLLPHQAALAMLPKQAANLLPTPLKHLVQDPVCYKKIFRANGDVDIHALLSTVESIPRSAYKPEELQRTVLGNSFLLRRAKPSDRLRNSYNPKVRTPGPRFEQIRAHPVIFRAMFTMTSSPPCYAWPQGSMRDTMNLPYLKVGGTQLLIYQKDSNREPRIARPKPLKPASHMKRPPKARIVGRSAS